MAKTDANDMMYYRNASRNYNPAPKLGTIQVPVLWINSADDYINPPEPGIAEKMVKEMPRRSSFDSDLGCDTRARHAYGGGGVEGLPGGVYAADGEPVEKIEIQLLAFARGRHATLVNSRTTWHIQAGAR